ncbi:malto-oligosyltrehalose trehalohydrolase [Azospirillum sp.]|uniref:malto-oligosyltrehalose trehalohydrolase n=1 Tax=Azospirillum sp. TaxID=34012 RepID=UPI003D72D542
MDTQPKGHEPVTAAAAFPARPPSPAAPRRYPVGVEPLPDGSAHARVWAPKRRAVALVVEPEGRAVTLDAEGNGYFSGLVEDMPAGSRYRFRLDRDETLYPDPVSRFQPEGPHGPSQVVDPFRFDWTDHAWKGRPLKGQVVYEMHVGTFTPEGTWEAAIAQLPHLAELGITVLEVMPVSDFAGRFGWGYDGVNLFAPTRLYGGPDDMRRFVDRAHGLGMAVILDVVYNHLGPDGNYLKCFSKAYFTDKYENEWGEAINFDGPDSGPVREFFIMNAACWVDEYHLDGLRLDATQQIFDASPVNVMAEISGAVRKAARGRATIVIGENEPQHSSLLRPCGEGGGACGLDGLWNDDFHHSAMVALTGRAEAYYTDYRGTPQEFVSALRHGFLYQGQWYKWQKKRRGMPAWGVDPAAMVTFLQNHDQVANSGNGLRVHALTAPGLYRAFTALTLLGPGTPMLFQGQEFAASSPFFYFADHTPELAEMVARGRGEFVAQFPSVATPAMQARLTAPHDPRTFERSKLDPAERERHAWATALHRDLLRLRREDPVFAAQTRPEGAVLDTEAFVLRFFGEDGDDRLLLVNMGRDLDLTLVPEPLLAPPAGGRWSLVWSSEDPVYGGGGTPAVETDGNWHLPGRSAVVLGPENEQESHA